MKEIIVKKEDAIRVDRFVDIADIDGYIGQEVEETRYFLVKSGSANGCLVRPDDTWAKLEFLGIPGKFYQFETRKELYEWLLENEND